MTDKKKYETRSGEEVILSREEFLNYPFNAKLTYIEDVKTNKKKTDKKKDSDEESEDKE